MPAAKIMLLCSKSSSETERHLRAAGCDISRVADGKLALRCAKRELFRAAVLVSTEGSMDLAETALNLRDVDPSLEIIIVAEPESADQRVVPAHKIANAIKKAKVLTSPEIGTYLGSSARIEHERQHILKVASRRRE
jgi:hypothetical protein